MSNCDWTRSNKNSINQQKNNRENFMTSVRLGFENCMFFLLFDSDNNNSTNDMSLDTLQGRSFVFFIYWSSETKHITKITNHNHSLLYKLVWIIQYKRIQWKHNDRSNAISRERKAHAMSTCVIMKSSLQK